ncbi:hypothetical protein QVD17_39831 [Tagetes erecta]|uniref:Uncharacterized protein n=1 Tax=Tagetes erecta TaxID=13708 RepID=A0AAD8NHH4_TARER|nr:hypothetical protein QVD17_39831 [Tagetes erecta]
MVMVVACGFGGEYGGGLGGGIDDVVVGFNRRFCGMASIIGEETQLVSTILICSKTCSNSHTLLPMSFAGNYFRIRSSIDSFSVACEAFSEHRLL